MYVWWLTLHLGCCAGLTLSTLHLLCLWGSRGQRHNMREVQSTCTRTKLHVETTNTDQSLRPYAADAVMRVLNSQHDATAQTQFV